ncbi:hypothetical protein [Hyalangium rubrum]|uniref:Lipoprotein n=1 Tax=Hyalangium rubrum TaxID=3103134 RepID=A0ABU5H9B4_9BACT|nr:hypothetical protein [Hyalangium sp. s54d21]MDY7229362.1 hypothetical protein [Hyalangium sp. s54d21]
MKRVLVAVLLAAATVMAGCDNSGDDQDLTESKVRLKSGESFDGAQRCGVDMAQCASGLSCVVVELEGAQAEALCVNEQNLCNQLECGQGECAILKSYPARVVCLSR